MWPACMIYLIVTILVQDSAVFLFNTKQMLRILYMQHCYSTARFFFVPNLNHVSRFSGTSKRPSSEKHGLRKRTSGELNAVLDKFKKLS